MKKFRSTLMAAAAGALCLALPAVPGLAQTAISGQPTVPLDVWALRDVVNAVEVSPDGKHVLVQKLESKEG